MTLEQTLETVAKIQKAWGRLGSIDIGCGRSICKDVGGGLLQP